MYLNSGFWVKKYNTKNWVINIRALLRKFKKCIIKYVVCTQNIFKNDNNNYHK